MAAVRLTGEDDASSHRCRIAARIEGPSGDLGRERQGDGCRVGSRVFRRNDICLTHTLIHPTINKATDETPGQENDVILRKVADTEHGIIVRGARILSTLAPFADELAVYPGRPLPDGGDKFAVSFCIPMATPGLKFICRDSVAGTDNKFDRGI
ncbi:MAG: hypothetical protein EXR07_05535 [Acetobacteraceae bacterium]|nr:hypothetical protein [Acetobacteraceae bacterium]